MPAPPSCGPQSIARMRRAPSAAGWTGWPTAASRRSPGRHPRAGAPHPRRGRDARRHLPGRPRRGRGARADRGRAADGRAATLPKVVPPRCSAAPTSRRRGPGSRPSTPASSTRSCATSSRRAPRRAASLREQAGELLADGSGRVFLANGPGDPAALDYVVDNVRELSACRCSGSASATSCSAGPSASRPSSCRSATAAPTTRSRTCRPARSRSPPEPRLRRARPGGARRSTATSRCAGRPTSAPPSSTHVNLYDRTVEGLELLDVPGGPCSTTRRRARGPHDAYTCSTASSSRSR